jgi:phosphoribosylaminoimidazolecarboxamide formyltransferase/IMP cyclohydrolase
VDEYSLLLDLITDQDGATTLADRKLLATKAFHVSSHYDTSIFNYFNTDETIFKASIADGKTLRYGENPHQKDSSLVILTPCLINYTEKNYHTITYLM